MLKSADAIHLTGIGYRFVQVLRKSAQQDCIDKGGFSAARNTRDRNETAKRDINVDIFEVVYPRALDLNRSTH